MGVQCRMNEAAVRSTELNAVLARTDYASAALRQTRTQLEDTRIRLRQQQDLLQSQQLLLAKLTQDNPNIEGAVILCAHHIVSPRMSPRATP